MKFKGYDGDGEITINITDEKKDLILERIIKYCKEHDCYCGETLHQSDDCLIYAPDVLSDIIDNILKPEVKWVE